MSLSRLHNRQVWSPGTPFLPPPTLPKAQALPLKLHKEHRTLTIPCVMKYWRLDLSLKKQTIHHCMPLCINRKVKETAAELL